MPEHVTNEELAAEVGIIKTRLDTFITTVERYIVSNDARQASLESKVNESRQFHWPILFSAIAALAVIIGGAFTILKQQTDLSVALALAPVVAEQGVSKTERTELRLAVSKNADSVTELTTFLTRQIERATEVETQIHDLHTIGNLDRSYQMAFIQLVWNRAYKEDFDFSAVETQPRILPR